jgi:adenylate cyclase
LKSLKNQLTLIFTAFVLVSIFTSLYTAYFFQKKEEISSLNNQLLLFEKDLLEALRQQESFYNFETINSIYFKTKESDYLHNYYFLKAKLHERLTSISANEIDSRINKKVNLITSQLNRFNNLFEKIVNSIIKRGFRNSGEEGKMRQAVHELEATSELNLVQILMSRRHEKDYILRQDPVYLKKHNEVIQQIRQDIYINTELSSERKNEITEIVERYVSSFEQVAAFERLIGLKSNTGLIKKK